jgi:streptogramin lyase
MQINNYRKLAVTLAWLALIVSESIGQSVYEPYTFTTLAGPTNFTSADCVEPWGYAHPGSSVDGPGNLARFNQPSGLAVDSGGNVYVADSWNNTIRKITALGAVTTLAGTPEFDTNGLAIGGYADGSGSTARFNFPQGVAVDTEGNVYVADTGNNAIRKITPSGTVTTLAGKPSIKNTTVCVNGPTGCNCLGPAGYVDGPGGKARFSTPVGIAVDNGGTLYVTELENMTLRKISPAGMVTTLVGSPEFDADGCPTQNLSPPDARFLGARGIALDSQGNIYVAGDLTIRKVTPAGIVTTLVGGESWGSADGIGSAAQFGGSEFNRGRGPYGVTVDPSGNVYVADSFNGTIRKVTPAGMVTTLAGRPGCSGLADGTGSAARFGILQDGFIGVSALAVDTMGNVYVADTANNTIRKGYPAFAAITTRGPGLGFRNGQFSFNIAAPTATSVVVDASTDLVKWLPLWTNLPAQDLHFTDSQAIIYPHRFYRARLP